MPRPDPPVPGPPRVALHRVPARPNRIVEIFERRKRKRRDDPDAGGVTVDPTRPRNLSGGAAAALEFDD